MSARAPTNYVLDSQDRSIRRLPMAPPAFRIRVSLGQCGRQIKLTGMNADPSCRRHAMVPVSMTITLAANPRKIPKAVHNCQDMTVNTPFVSWKIALVGSNHNSPRAPRILVGAFSAAKIGTVDPFAPIPRPMTSLERGISVSPWISFPAKRVLTVR